jgi:hypothetical protein
MTLSALLSQASDLSASDYVVLGVATCFIREDSEIYPVKIVEPIPSAALEAILKGIETSYEFAYATTLEQVLDYESGRLPDGFPPDAQLCDDFHERLTAAARTYLSNPNSTVHISVGNLYRDLNYSVSRKRLLNSERIVKTEDNVKQHKYTHETL